MVCAGGRYRPRSAVVWLTTCGRISTTAPKLRIKCAERVGCGALDSVRRVRFGRIPVPLSTGFQGDEKQFVIESDLVFACIAPLLWGVLALTRCCPCRQVGGGSHPRAIGAEAERGRRLAAQALHPGHLRARDLLQGTLHRQRRDE